MDTLVLANQQVNIHKFWMDIRCRLEDLPVVMCDRDE